jgi:hypothetical protein
MYFLLCGASILHHSGGLHKLGDVLGLDCLHVVHIHIFDLNIADGGGAATVIE